MKKSFFGLIIMLILLTTYTPKFNYIITSKLNIQKIIVENITIIDSVEIKKKLNFLYKTNLFFLNINKIEENLKNISFIKSYSIKKIYPNTLKLIIYEKKPIAILQKKKEKFYISEKGSLINYKKIERYEELPIVFGNEKNFYALYQNLNKIKFPLNEIKSYYFFESGRWDLVLRNDKVIKLPVKDYLFSLKNFMISQKNKKLNYYKIFDYRIKDQLILN